MAGHHRLAALEGPPAEHHEGGVADIGHLAAHGHASRVGVELQGHQFGAVFAAHRDVQLALLGRTDLALDPDVVDHTGVADPDLGQLGVDVESLVLEAAGAAAAGAGQAPLGLLQQPPGVEIAGPGRDPGAGLVEPEVH